MSTGYGWEVLRQVCATLLGARHVPERMRWGLPAKGRYKKCSSFTFYLLLSFLLTYLKRCVCCAGIQAELTTANTKGAFPSSQVLVTVTVQGVNDNRPTFSRSTYSGKLSDCALPGSLLSMDSLIRVTDRDQVYAPLRLRRKTLHYNLFRVNVCQHCSSLDACPLTKVT